jgi:hypothetical protein
MPVTSPDLPAFKRGNPLLEETLAGAESRLVVDGGDNRFHR